MVWWSSSKTAKGQISQKVTLDNTGGNFFFFFFCQFQSLSRFFLTHLTQNSREGILFGRAKLLIMPDPLVLVSRPPEANQTLGSSLLEGLWKWLYELHCYSYWTDVSSKQWIKWKSFSSPDAYVNVGSDWEHPPPPQSIHLEQYFWFWHPNHTQPGNCAKNDLQFLVLLPQHRLRYRALTCG